MEKRFEDKLGGKLELAKDPGGMFSKESPRLTEGDDGEKKLYLDLKTEREAADAKSQPRLIATLADLKTLHKEADAQPAYGAKDTPAIQTYVEGKKEDGRNASTTMRHRRQFVEALEKTLDIKVYNQTNWKNVWNNQVTNNLTAFLSDQIDFKSLRGMIVLAVKVSLAHEQGKVTGHRGSLAKGNAAIARIRRPLTEQVLTDLDSKLEEEKVPTAERFYITMVCHIKSADFIRLCVDYEHPNTVNLGTTLTQLLTVHKAIAQKLSLPIVPEGDVTPVGVNDLVNAFQRLKRMLDEQNNGLTPKALKIVFADFFTDYITARGRDYCWPRLEIIPGREPFTCYEVEVLMQDMLCLCKRFDQFTEGDITAIRVRAETLAKAQPSHAARRSSVVSEQELQAGAASEKHERKLGGAAGAHATTTPAAAATEPTMDAYARLRRASATGSYTPAAAAAAASSSAATTTAAATTTTTSTTSSASSGSVAAPTSPPPLLSAAVARARDVATNASGAGALASSMAGLTDRNAAPATGAVTAAATTSAASNAVVTPTPALRQ